MMISIYYILSLEVRSYKFSEKMLKIQTNYHYKFNNLRKIIKDANNYIKHALRFKCVLPYGNKSLITITESIILAKMLFK